MLEKEKQIHIIKQNSFSKTLKSYIQIRANISFPHAMEFMELIPWDKYKINTIQLHPPLASQPLLPLEENGTRSERIQTTTMSDTHLAPTLAIHSQLGKKNPPTTNKQINKKAKQSKKSKSNNLYKSVFHIQSVFTENTPGRCNGSICNHEKLKTFFEGAQWKHRAQHSKAFKHVFLSLLSQSGAGSA